VVSPHDLRLALAWTLAALALFAALALALGCAFAPEAIAQGAPWRLAGIAAPSCPGCGLCGMSRAFAALGHGRVAEAVGHNTLALAAWLLAWLVALSGPLFLARTLTSRRRACRSLR